MSGYTFFSGLLCGLLLLSGVFSLFLYFRNIEKKTNLAYFFLAVFLGALLLVGLVSGFVDDLTQAIIFDKLINSFFILAGIAFLFMITYWTGYRQVRLLGVLIIGLLLFLAVNWILPYGITWEQVTGIEARNFIGQEQRFFMVGKPGIQNLVTILLVLSVMTYAGLAIAHQLRHGDSGDAKRLIIVAGVAFVGILLDTILIELQLNTIHLIGEIGFFGMAFLVGHRNVSNLIQTNAKIRENEQRLARLTEAAFEGIAFTEQGEIVDANSQLAGMLGYEIGEMIGEQTVKFVDDASVSYVEAKQLQSLESSYEYLARHKDGHAIPVEVNVKNILLKDRVIRVNAIRDASERLKAETQSTLLAKTIKSVRDCISVTDMDNRLIFVNDSFLQAYGYTEEEVLGKPMSMFRSSREFNTSETDIRMALIEEGDWYGELLNIRKDGTEFPIELWASPVKDAEGNTVAYVGVARDISERKRNEQALVDEKERAERSEKLKDAFIANISHEVRTPLNIIVGYTGLISELMVSKATDEEMQYFESVQRGVHRLMRTVDMILNISRLQVGDFELSFVSLNLSETVQQIVDDFHSVARAKNLALSFVTEIPDATIVADMYCLNQSVHNLLDNAVKYTLEGSIIVRVFCSNPEEFSVSISDTGVGISTEYLSSVFQPYTQEDTGYSRSYDGIGLGLSLVKRYADLNRSSVRLESTKGVGTTVTLAFPRTVGDAGANGTTIPVLKEEQPETMIENEILPRQSILLVEDDSLTVEFMRAILGRDYSLHVASSAVEAMGVLQATPIDIILMDLSLSGEKNGLELTAELKASVEWGRIPIIAATAHAFPEDRQRCLDSGCDGYISKPIEKKLLVEIIDRLCLGR
jgi:PAS domain S-box-containing protein